MSQKKGETVATGTENEENEDIYQHQILIDIIQEF